MTNGNKFKSERILMVDKMLERADSLTVYSTELKSPSVVLIISLLVGQLGIDRYVLGDKKIGTVKLALFLLMYVSIFVMSFSAVNIGVERVHDHDIAIRTIIYLAIFCMLMLTVTIFWIYDAATISGRTKEVNFQRLCDALGRSYHPQQACDDAIDPSKTNE